MKTLLEPHGFRQIFDGMKADDKEGRGARVGWQKANAGSKMIAKEEFLIFKR